MNRREFLHTFSAAAAVLPSAVSTASAMKKGVRWPVGCFNRPWTAWSLDETFAGVKSAGYGLTGLLSRTKSDPFIGSNATPEYLAGIKNLLKAHGLKANMGALSSRHSIPLEESINDVQKQIDNAAFLSLEFVLSFGVDRPEQVDHYFKVMSAAAAYAQKKKVKVAMKPHGGSSGASDEILRSIEKVAHPNFKIWYDAGNIIHYTGKDPVAELKPVAKYVTGFCAKDCGQLKGDVMIQFGTGKVNFKAVFDVLKQSGFKGPIMVECCALDKSKDVVTANARANREFLEKVLAEV
jgi:sugar phosphate isomerase/epimerase